MSNLNPVFVRAKEILINHGWYCGGARGNGGASCIIIACCDAYEEIYGYRALSHGENCHIIDILKEAIGTESVPGWNDNPERTFDEVIAVLDKAILLTAPEQVKISV